MVKASIKKFVLKCLNILLKDNDIKRTIQIELASTNFNSENLKHVPLHYDFYKNFYSQINDLADRAKGKGAVIITGRFRSGTTLFWNMFRNADGYHSFYEPFNERRWFDPKVRGNNVDGSHRGVEDYWDEYEGFEQLKKYYKEDWIRAKLLMTKDTWAPDMLQFVEYLIQKPKYRPVLQFNRIDFRLPWFKHHFPNAKYLHIYRNPRDQFCSFLIDKKKMNCNDVHKTYVDGFYLYSWCADLSTHYPFLSLEQNLHPYKYFYFVWKLSFIFSTTYSDLSVSYEELTQNPEESLQKIFTLLQDEKINIKKLSSLIDQPAIEGWKNYADEKWFREHEYYCEKVLKTYFNL